jgi:hypothetical protein
MNRIGIGPRQGWTVFSEETDPESHFVLRVLAQPAPPLAKFVRELDFPGHESIMFLNTYIVKGIMERTYLALYCTHSLPALRCLPRHRCLDIVI